jgi:cyclohexadieny/prephenate dehydrogenase
MLFDQITIVGVGLIGGSVGMAAKARGAVGRVVGTGRDPKTLARAAELGAVDAHTTDLADAVRTSGLVVVCTPVDRIADVILRAAPHCRPGTIFTDGGSTKGNILAELDGRLPDGVTFVPAHPLAGSEKNGVQHARADLFDNRLTILTPTDDTDTAAVDRVEAFWRAIGSRVVRLPPVQHDQVLAATSHLPHAVAAAVAGVTPVEWLGCTAGGFRDTTRIAGGDPHLWAAIFRANRDAVHAALDRFTARLDTFRALLEAGDRDGLVEWLSEAKQVRDALGT